MRVGVITIEIPLDGGELEDARTLADMIARRTLTTNLHDIQRDSSLIYGRVTDVKLANREGAPR
jgi:hypothetical protein